jgi:hypothetical protein
MTEFEQTNWEWIYLYSGLLGIFILSPLILGKWLVKEVLFD